MQLDRGGYQRARTFLLEAARPVERELFRHAFEGAPARPALDALAAFANPDGGFGHGLEPDLRLPDSSALATSVALQRLRELGATADEPLVVGALGFLRESYDPALRAWRCVPPAVDAHPRAPHWNWSLHEDGRRWPVTVNPRAELLAHFYAYRELVDPAWAGEVEAALRADLPGLGAEVGADSLLCCEILVHTPEAPADLREAASKRVRELGLAMVNRDPDAWSGYVPKPLKLAPLPDATLAPDLAADLERNLDYEIAHQESDGAWSPNWTWSGAFPEDWERARREWQGILTLERLRSLRAFGRLADA